jgi:antirestriction protein ArdC
MHMSAPTRARSNVYQSVTRSIITAIEAGSGHAELPWRRVGGRFALPVNAFTGKRYRGVNVVALWSAQASSGFITHLWATYRQWMRLGAQVRRGEKSAPIVFYKEVDEEKQNEATGEKTTSKRLTARASFVFSADQVDCYQRPTILPVNPVQVIKLAEHVATRTGARVQHGGNRAFYSPSEDYIQMPERAAFTGTATCSPTEGYYATLLHELVHWSGAKHRIDRDISGRFGSNAYAVEELVAELGSAFLCAELSVAPAPRPDHAAYIADWLRVMKGDNRAIFTAASKAAAAAEYLLGLQASDDNRTACETKEYSQRGRTD